MATPSWLSSHQFPPSGPLAPPAASHLSGNPPGESLPTVIPATTPPRSTKYSERSIISFKPYTLVDRFSSTWYGNLGQPHLLNCQGTLPCSGPRQCTRTGGVVTSAEEIGFDPESHPRPPKPLFFTKFLPLKITCGSKIRGSSRIITRTCSTAFLKSFASTATAYQVLHQRTASCALCRQARLSTSLHL